MSEQMTAQEVIDKFRELMSNEQEILKYGETVLKEIFERYND